MEIAPTPRRRRWSPAASGIVALLVLGPVTVLALVPTAFGLERYLMSEDDMSGSLGRGSVAFEQRVPLGDVAVDDVVTFSPREAEAGPDSALVTRRVTAIRDGQVMTAADTYPDRMPMALRVEDQATVSRVLFVVPFVGYPFLGAMSSTGVALLVIAVGVGVGVASTRGPRSRGSHSPPGTRGSHQAGTTHLGVGSSP